MALINNYVVLMQEYYSNCSKNITDIELQLMSDFFDKIPTQYQKSIFKSCVKENEFFPKLCKVQNIYDGFVRNINYNLKNKKLSSNESHCSICNDIGIVVYYSDGINKITQSEFYSDFDKYSFTYDKYICCCSCNNGKNKESKFLIPYVFNKKSG